MKYKNNIYFIQQGLTSKDLVTLQAAVSILFYKKD